MPYSFPNNIPRPARNWTEEQQKKCIAAANGALRGGASEQDAIFACIRAAGKTVHPGGEGSSMPESEMWVDLFNAEKVLKGEPVCLVPRMEEGYHRGGLKREPITQDTLIALAQNFEQRATSGYYMDSLPLNIEHDDLGGAIGSIQSVQLQDDGLYAIFDLTPKGKEKLEEGGFSYLSPEIRWNTIDVVSGEDIGPTLAGAAATNYPFWGNRTAMYSDQAIDRLGKDYPIETRVAGKMGVLVEQFRGLVAMASNMLERFGASGTQTTNNESDSDDSQEIEQEVTMGGTEKLEVPQEFLDKMTSLEEQVEQFGRQLGERDTTIQAQRQEIDALNLARIRDRFTARAAEFHAIGAENGDLASELTWLWQVDQTEERTHFTFFDGLLGQIDQALSESQAFQEVGRQVQEPSRGDAFARIDGMVSKLAKERNIDAPVGSQAYNDLTLEVLRQNQDLYEQHRQTAIEKPSQVPA